MSKDNKNSGTGIVEGLSDLGENFGLIMIPEPLACPNCGSTDFKRLIYGLPAEDLTEEERDYYRPGGCVVRIEDWHCENCCYEW